MIELLVIGLLGIWAVQLAYLFLLYNRIYRHNKSERGYAEESFPVSVILTAKDEESNLRECLPLILEQDYPAFEVIVVNDNSTDGTEELLVQMERKYSNLYHTFTSDSARYLSYKKLALTVGIKASRYDWLLFTEPDCRPYGKEWIRIMARNFTPQTDFVLGYAGYEEKGSQWLCRKSRFLSLFSAMRFLGMAIAGHPYMGSGRNLAYRKSFFMANKGFSSYLNLKRGEDDLFVNQFATAKNTRVETDASAVVRVISPENNRMWREERMSYAVTSRFYRGTAHYLPSIETLSRVVFFFLFVCIATVGSLQRRWLEVGVSCLLLLSYWTAQWVLFNRTCRSLGFRRHYYFQVLLFDLLQPFHAVFTRLLCLFRKKSEYIRQ